MKPTPISIRINKPCHEDWDQMTPTEQGRFCGSCQKNVTDFSAMTDNEILAFLNEHTGSMCGQLRGSQLNRVIVHTKLTGSKWKLNSFMTALMVAGGAGIASAQSTPPQNNQTVIIDENHPTGPVCIRTIPKTTEHVLSAYVLDTIANNAVAYATIRVVGTDIITNTNEEGDFKLTIPADYAGDSITLQIASPGYYRKEVTIAVADLDKTKRIEVGLDEYMMKGEMMIEIPPRKCGNDKRQ